MKRKTSEQSEQLSGSKALAAKAIHPLFWVAIGSELAGVPNGRYASDRRAFEASHGPTGGKLVVTTPSLLRPKEEAVIEIMHVRNATWGTLKEFHAVHTYPLSSGNDFQVAEIHASPRGFSQLDFSLGSVITAVHAAAVAGQKQAELNIRAQRPQDNY
jgi:hypothetical protein